MIKKETQTNESLFVNIFLLVQCMRNYNEPAFKRSQNQEHKKQQIDKRLHILEIGQPYAKPLLYNAVYDERNERDNYQKDLCYS